MDMAGMQDAQDTRRDARRNADRPSTLRGADSGPHDSWVHDVSRTGMRIECRAALAVGEEVTVGLAGAGATAARIVWRRGHEYGCAFTAPLSAEDAAAAFRAAPVVQLRPAGAAAAVPPAADPATRAMLSLIEEQPARGRGWMAALAVGLVATAVPAAVLLARLF